MHSQSDWPYRVEIYHADWLPLQAWCEQTIGEFDRDWYKLGMDLAEMVENGCMKTVWLFRRADHAMLFKLRWV
jgi:hypothetical protein